MRNYDCVSCPFVKKIKRVTKPMYLCTRGRYVGTPDGGYPVSWIKKCDYDKEIKGVQYDTVFYDKDKKIDRLTYTQKKAEYELQKIEKELNK